jgi:hypothetical protein
MWRIAVVLFTYLIALGFPSPLFADDKTQRADNVQTATIQDRRGTVQSPLVVQGLPAPEPNHWTDPITWFTGSLAALTGLLALLTGGLVYVGLRQDESNRTMQRAYVKMSHTEPGLDWRGSNGAFSIAMEIRNFGNTPANVTDIVLRQILLPDGTPLPPVPDYTRQRDKASFHAFLVKDESFVYENPQPFSVGSAVKEQEVLDSVTSLYVFGFVDYIDKFGVRHRSGYARKFLPNPIKNMPHSNNLVFVTDPGYNYDWERYVDEGNDWADATIGERMRAGRKRGTHASK